MRKKMIIKTLKNHFEVSIKRFDTYDFQVKTETKTFFVKVLHVSVNHQITVNSKTIWDLKKGVISGIRFKTVSSNLINLEGFNKLENKVILLTSKPFKILQALNESDLLDISNESFVNNTFISSDISKLIDFLKK